MQKSRVINIRKEVKEMLVNDWNVRKTARDYVHYIYRNTEIEDLHAVAVKMDMSTYEIVKKIIEKNRQVGAKLCNDI